MTDGETIETFYCGECKHHLRVRADAHTVICAITLQMVDRDQRAACEYAERRRSANRDGSDNH